jgi:hypothetical protein
MLVNALIVLPGASAAIEEMQDARKKNMRRLKIMLYYLSDLPG